MVGHSGNFLATVTACEFLDEQLRLLYHECVEKRGGIMIITADHGNAETMLYPNKTVHTSHTNNKVPVIIAHQKLQGAMISDDNNRSLADIAPTILTLLGLKVPSAMTGKSLV